MEKVTFRKLGIEDLELRYKWLTDPETNKYLGTRLRNGQDKSSFKKWLDEYLKDDTKLIFIIEVDGMPIGQVGLARINLDDKNASLYLVIGEKNYRGKGYGKEAIKYILDYSFKNLGLHKVWLEVHVANLVALGLYKKMGFVEEGYFKGNVLYDGKYVDEIRMAIINKVEDLERSRKEQNDK